MRFLNTVLLISVVFVGGSCAAENRLRAIYVDANLGFRIIAPKFPLKKGIVTLVSIVAPPVDGFGPHLSIDVDKACDRETYIAEGRADDLRLNTKTLSEERLTLAPNVEAVYNRGEFAKEGRQMHTIELAAFRKDHRFGVIALAPRRQFNTYAPEFESCVRSFRFISGADEAAVRNLGWKSYYLHPEFGLAIRTPNYSDAIGTPRIVANFCGGTLGEGEVDPLPMLEVVLRGTISPQTVIQQTKEELLSANWRVRRQETWTVFGAKQPVLECVRGAAEEGVCLTFVAVSDGKRTFVLRAARALADADATIAAEIEASMKSFCFLSK